MSERPDDQTAPSPAEERRTQQRASRRIADDIAALEAALLADIEAFDLDAAERQARQEQLDQAAATPAGAAADFPEIMAPATAAALRHPPPTPAAPLLADAPVLPAQGVPLLDELRQQANRCERELHATRAEHHARSVDLDRLLKELFTFLHELVQHLNIVKPAVPRDYPLIDAVAFRQLAWEEGFADYRTQAQSDGALIEQVSLSYRLAAPSVLHVDRDELAAARFRSLLFDYGLQFSCDEVRNSRHHLERATFSIPSLLSVTTRWRADFAQGRIVLETRNLERLGSTPYHVRPQAMTQALYEEFGRLILGQPNRFRQLLRA